MAADRSGASTVPPWTPPGTGPLHLDAPLPWPGVADRARQDLLRAKTWPPGSLVMADASGELVPLLYPGDPQVILARGANGLPAWRRDVLVALVRVAQALVVGANQAVQAGFVADVIGDLRVSSGLNVGGTTAPGDGSAIVTTKLAVNQTAEASGDAAFEVGGTDGFVLLPRLTTAQRDALTPVAGALIFNTTTNEFQGYNGTVWSVL